MRIFLLFELMVIIYADVIPPVVKISSGLIEGEFISNDFTEKPYYSFKGIPYAEPPIGRLRFQPPVKVVAWNGTLITKNDGSKCVQKNGGNENCLFINVYTPTIPEAENNKLLPVMVYFHGGAFTHGSSNSSYFGPEYLIDKNVILVTVNYRLNIFGFLNAFNELAPGNVGLKDQVASLEWVQENISKFGGNRKLITIFGHSAGSASCLYLLQFKSHKGLFHKAILQSGSPLSHWAFERNPVLIVEELKNALKINNNNNTEFIYFLRSLSSEELFNAYLEISEIDKNRVFKPKFVPSIEYESPDAYMLENSFSVLSNKNFSIPIICGYTNFEALFFLKGLKNRNIKYFENNPLLFVPLGLNINDNNETLQLAFNEIKQYFFKNESSWNLKTYLKFRSGDIVRGIQKAIELMRENNNIYFYLFSYQDKSKNLEIDGVPHGGELRYIFNTGDNESDEDKLVREKITTLWTNFATHGDPTFEKNNLLDNIQWPLLSKNKNDTFKYLNINTVLKIEDNPDQETFIFWEKLFDKYGKKPFDSW